MGGHVPNSRELLHLGLKPTSHATEACADPAELPKQTADVLAEARVVTCTYTKSHMRCRHVKH